ncbi:hypothetical protein [Burkholderia sp. BCC0405]|uniref:T6SS immunity protein Tli3 family protein n=1 Tax=Burkholderia sp. BCC0405 TaxID=2676298 RepID=UPI001FC8BE6F|nr:hypothetical protein [Burkholderia sp. BCC0405]
MIKLLNDRVRFGGLVIEKIRAILAVLVMSFLLVACANSAQSTASAPSKADFREYVVYRIDDSRYITIRSKHPCIVGQMDGQIFYYDDSKNVRTLVSFTGGENTGLYRGYYAVRSSANYIAIPSRSESERRGGLLHINYSRDGGQTFQWLLLGGDSKDYALIQDENYLYFTQFDRNNPNDYSDRSGFVLDINRAMDPEISHYDNAAMPFARYGKPIARRQIPLTMKSPSGATHWTCPTTSKD